MTGQPPEHAETATPEPNGRWALDQIEEALRGLQFGIVTVIVQDGVVVQLERLERRRLRSPRKR
jgi:hypothetical protein